ncbi:hypothetical protein GCM10027562_12890 [Arthrobacter pigmenti]
MIVATHIVSGVTAIVVTVVHVLTAAVAVHRVTGMGVRIMLAVARFMVTAMILVAAHIVIAVICSMPCMGVHFVGVGLVGADVTVVRLVV